MNAWDDEMSGENPYKKSIAPVEKSVAAEAGISRAVSEVQAQVVIAKKYPRDVVQATDAILAECDIPQLAEVAIYTYPKGTAQVEGPSIRLAEVIKRNWGNMVSGVVELDRRGDESSMLAYAWDLEKNNMERREFKVKHWRDTKKGGYALTDERDIYETSANNGARRERACILACIPGHVVNAAVARCRKTIELGIGDLTEAIRSMIEAFKGLGVEQIQIERMLHHRIDTTSAAEMVHLRGIYSAIRDNYGKVEDFFEPISSPSDNEPKSTTADKARAAAARAASAVSGTQAEKTPENPASKEQATKPESEKTEAPKGDKFSSAMGKLKDRAAQAAAQERVAEVAAATGGLKKGARTADFPARPEPTDEQTPDGLDIY